MTFGDYFIVFLLSSSYSQKLWPRGLKCCIHPYCPEHHHQLNLEIQNSNYKHCWVILQECNQHRLEPINLDICISGGYNLCQNGCWQKMLFTCRTEPCVGRGRRLFIVWTVSQGVHVDKHTDALEQESAKSSVWIPLRCRPKHSWPGNQGHIPPGVLVRGRVTAASWDSAQTHTHTHTYIS